MSWDPHARLDVRRLRLLEEFEELLRDFNRRINLISREDEGNIALHHVRHSLFLTYRPFPSGSTIVDWGAGGGLPSIPLAIALPDVHVIAVDAVEKKVQAVRAMARRLALGNLEARPSRAEEFTVRAAYSVSRAAAPLDDLWAWHARLEAPGSPAYGEGCWRPGLVCLKGGELREETASIADKADVEIIPLSDLDPHPYFAGKVMIACTPHAASAYEPGSGGNR